MTRNRKFIFPLGALLAIVALAAVVVIVRASADDLLYQSADLLANATDGHAIVSFKVVTPEKTESGTFEVWGQKEFGPNGEPAFRLEVQQTTHDQAVGVVAVSNGDQVWISHPLENTVYVGTVEELKTKMREHAEANDYEGGHPFDHSLPQFEEGERPETPEEFVDWLLQYFEAERAGTIDVNNVTANHIQMIPIPEMMPDEIRANGGLLHIMLGDDGVPLAAEYSGGAVGSAEISAADVQINQGVDPAYFNFEISEGVEIVQLADLKLPEPSKDEMGRIEDFDVLTPAKLPSAARLDDTVEVRGAVVQRYRLPDGADFTIAQGAADAGRTPQNSRGESITVRGVQGMLYGDESGTRTLLTWTGGDTTFWIGGDLTADDALEIANSLQ